MKAFNLTLLVSALILSITANAAPALDTTFSSTGKRNIWFDLPTEKWDEGTDAVVQSDGKIVIVGFARKAPISGTGDVSDLTVARLNADGSTDTSFATNGKLSMNLAGSGRQNDRANAVALDSAGRIYIAGNSEAAAFVLRLLPSGAVDTSYAYFGRFTFLANPQYPATFRFDDIAIDASGRAVVVGTQERATGSLNDGMVLRLLSTGQLDSSFTGVPDAGNSLGFRTLSLLYGQAYNDEIKRVAIAPDGSIYAAGSFQGTGNDFDFMVYKMNGTNGALVQSFGSGGIKRAYQDQGDKYDRLADMKLLQNGNLRLLGNCRVTGLTQTRGCLVGLTAYGAYDSAFSSLQAGSSFRSFPLNAECNGYGAQARALVTYGGSGNRVAVVGEQQPQFSTPCTGISAMAMQTHTDSVGVDVCGASNGTDVYASVCGGSYLQLSYSSLGSWANGAVLDAQGRLMVVGATVLSASDTDQASARISGY